MIEPIPDVTLERAEAVLSFALGLDRRAQKMAEEIAKAGCCCDAASYPDRGRPDEFSHSPDCGVATLLQFARLITGEAQEQMASANRRTAERALNSVEDLTEEAEEVATCQDS